MKKIIYLLTLLTFALTITSVSHAATKYKPNYVDIHTALQSDEYIVSQNEFFYAQLHNDGNFVIYKGTGPQENYGKVWETGTHGVIGDYSMMIADDGNIVIYSGKPWAPSRLMWTTGFHGEDKHGDPTPKYFNLQDDGNLSLFSGADPQDSSSVLVWDTKIKIEINWAKNAKYLLNHFVGDNGFLTKGGSVSIKELAQKWYFSAEGEIKPNNDMTKCLAIGPAKGPRNFYHDLILETCTGSEVQKSWGLYNGKIRNDTIYYGCAIADKNGNAQFVESCYAVFEHQANWSLR